MKFALHGADEALRNVRQIRESINDRALREDGLQSLQPIVEDAKALAPVEEGDLRDSIEATVFDDGTIGVIIRDWKGHFFEFGTVNMRAQPMLIPAVEANEAIVIDLFSERVAARIEGAFVPRAAISFGN